MYMGLNQSMMGGFGDSQTASFIFNEGKSSVHVHSTHWNEMATSDFGPVTVTICETELFFIHIWIILWDATTKSLIHCLTDLGGGGSVYLGRCMYLVEYGIQNSYFNIQ